MQLEFSNPLYISLDNLHKDSLKVSITDPSTFVSAIDFVTTTLPNDFDEIEMPR